MHNITFTDISGCDHKPSDAFAIVHACKELCHCCAANHNIQGQKAQEYSKRTIGRGFYIEILRFVSKGRNFVQSAQKTNY